MGGRLFKRYYFILFKSIIVMILIAFSVLFYNTLSNINEEKLDSFYKLIIDDKTEYSRSVINRTIQGIEMERQIVKSQQVKDVNEVVELLKEYLDIYRDVDLSKDPLFLSYLKKRTHCNVIVFKNNSMIFNSCEDKKLEDIVDEDYIIVKNNWAVGNSSYNSFVFVENQIIDDIVKARLIKRIRNSKLLNDERIFVNKIHRNGSMNGPNIEKLEVIVNPLDVSKEGDYIFLDEVDYDGKFYRVDEIVQITEFGEAIYDIKIDDATNGGFEHTYIVSKLYPEYDWIISVSFSAGGIEKSLDIERSNLNIMRGKQILLFIAIVVSLIGLVYIMTSIIELRDKVKKENSRLIEAGKVIGNELMVMRDKANLDPLTNLYNRRAIEEKFMSFMKKNQFVDYSVLMCDIDNFKDINDKQGHDVGDCVLRKVASTITDTLRKEDVVSRWGGDEFLVILFDSDKHTSLIVAEKIKKAVETIVVGCDDFETQLTISIGIAKSYAGLSYQEVISLADVALYKSKNAGKNCITVMEK
jgi:diguanylate cyclase (GGDEF)-like protein